MKGESIFNRLKGRVPAKKPKDILRAQATPPPSELHRAILDEDPVRIKSILDSGTANINDVKASYDSPLHWACAIGNPEIINLLIEFGANPHLVNRGIWTPISYAMSSNNPAAMDAMFAHGIALPTADFKMLALHYINWALLNDATDCLRHLFQIILARENQELALRYMVLLWVIGIDEFYTYIPATKLGPLIEEMLGNYNVLMNYVVKNVHGNFSEMMSFCRQQIRESVLRNYGEQKQSLAHWGARYDNLDVFIFCQQNQPALLTMADGQGLSPLAWAIRHDHVNATLFLGPRTHCSLLGHYIVKNKAISVLRALAQRARMGFSWERAIFAQVDTEGDSPLLCAGRAGDFQLFKTIADGFPQTLNWRGRWGETIIERLIENEFTAERGENLIPKGREKKYEPFFRDLLKFYPQLWEENLRPNAYPPIALAAKLASVYILEMLFKKDPDSIDWIHPDNQERLTHVAARYESIPVMAFLLLNRPELLIAENKEGQTPLLLVALEKSDVMEWYFYQDEFKRVIEVGLPAKLKSRLPCFQTKGLGISREEERELLIALKDNLPHLKPDRNGETVLSLTTKKNCFYTINLYAELASPPEGLSSPLQRALALAFDSAFEWRDAKGNNLLHRIADCVDVNRNGMASLCEVLDEEAEVTEQENFNENIKQIYKIKAIETILERMPDSLAQQNKLGKTPAQMIGNPLFFAYLKVARRSQFWNLPDPACMRPKKKGTPHGPSLFKSLYDWAIQDYLSIYLYLRYSPFFRDCSVSIDGVNKIIFEYTVWHPLHYIFCSVLFNGGEEARKSKLLLLDEGIRTLYADRYVALPECKILISDAKTSEIAVAVENHDYRVRIAALQHEWRQRTEEVPHLLSTATSPATLN